MFRIIQSRLAGARLSRCQKSRNLFFFALSQNKGLTNYKLSLKNGPFNSQIGNQLQHKEDGHS